MNLLLAFGSLPDYFVNHKSRWVLNTNVREPGEVLIVAHPDYAPIRWNEGTLEWDIIEPEVKQR